MMDGRCKDCRWWNGNRIAMPRVAFCLRIENRPDRFFDTANGMAVVGSGRPGNSLLVSPDFGCVLFERREVGA